jgi:choline-phosphate cytidylyltransferase
MVRRIYIDGIFDLFHKGHVLHLKKIKELDNQENQVIVGIISDQDAINYKRKPIYDEEHRKILIESSKYVDEVIIHAPLVIDESFLEKHKIDLVCHAFMNKEDEEKQSDFFKIPIKLNKFRAIDYYSPISTSLLLKEIRSNE